MRPGKHPLPVLLLLRPGKPEAGVDTCQRLLGKAGRRHRRAAGLHHLDKSGIAETGIGRPRRALAEEASLDVTETRAAAAAATIDSDEERREHPENPVDRRSDIIMPLQSQMEKGGSRSPAACPLPRLIFRMVWRHSSVDNLPCPRSVRSCPKGERYDTNLISLWGGCLSQMNTTETHQPRSVGLDAMADEGILGAFLEGQERAVAAVRDATRRPRQATRAIVARIGEDGRLIYVGAGSSGLIAALDGMELAGTFGWPEARTAFLLAGGYTIAPGLAGSVEDDAERGRAEMVLLKPKRSDAVIAVAASGSTPFTVAATVAASEAGALTVGLASNASSPLSQGRRRPGLSRYGRRDHRRLDPHGRRHRAEGSARSPVQPGDDPARPFMTASWSISGPTTPSFADAPCRRWSRSRAARSPRRQTPSTAPAAGSRKRRWCSAALHRPRPSGACRGRRQPPHRIRAAQLRRRETASGMPAGCRSTGKTKGE